MTFSRLDNHTSIQGEDFEGYRDVGRQLKFDTQIVKEFNDVIKSILKLHCCAPM